MHSLSLLTRSHEQHIRSEAAAGKNPLQLDSKKPSIPLEDYIYNEIRYKMLAHKRPDEAKRLLTMGQEFVNERWKMYESMAAGNNGA